ncbi:MAG: invasion associated locus B family protein [Pseudomonadota bacterium]
MRNLRLYALAVALTVLCGPPAALGQDQRPETVRDTHGDWEIRCVDGSEVCVMSQTGQGPTGTDVLEVRIRKLEGVTTDEGQAVPAAIQISAPLGVLLRGGVQMKIDQNEPRIAPFEICVPNRCLVRDVLSDDLVGQMRAGSVATMTVFSPNQGEVAVNISLRGFTRAFQTLQPLQQR